MRSSAHAARSVVFATVGDPARTGDHHGPPIAHACLGGGKYCVGSAGRGALNTSSRTGRDAVEEAGPLRSVVSAQVRHSETGLHGENIVRVCTPLSSTESVT
jgi:hypothetical protein